MRKRIHNKGAMVDSSTMYEPTINSHSVPVLVLDNTVNLADNIPSRRITRSEFERENLFCKLVSNIDDYYPELSTSKKSKLYKAIRDYMYKLLLINNKTLQEQGFDLKVA